MGNPDKDADFRFVQRTVEFLENDDWLKFEQSLTDQKMSLTTFISLADNNGRNPMRELRKYWRNVEEYWFL